MPNQRLNVTEFPCPKCGTSREAINAKCGECGWFPLPSHGPVMYEVVDNASGRHGQFSISALIVCMAVVGPLSFLTIVAFRFFARVNDNSLVVLLGVAAVWCPVIGGSAGYLIPRAKRTSNVFIGVAYGLAAATVAMVFVMCHSVLTMF